jgi:hypothetical protein
MRARSWHGGGGGGRRRGRISARGPPGEACGGGAPSARGGGGARRPLAAWRGKRAARTVHRPQGMHAGVPSRAAGNPWVLLHAFPTPPGMSTGRVGSILLLATISISPCCRARDHVTVPARWSCAGLGLRVLARSCAHGGKQVRLAFTLATWHASYAAVLADQRQNLRRPRTRSMHAYATHARSCSCSCSDDASRDHVG